MISLIVCSRNPLKTNLMFAGNVISPRVEHLKGAKLTHER
jgi:hypothetical protein